jgi:hypothetical protein
MRRGTIVVLDVADDELAVGMAQKIAERTGRSVTVRDSEMIEILTIPAATSH